MTTEGEGMKKVRFVAIGGLTAAALLAAASIAPLASASAGAAPCTAKPVTIKKSSGLALCGPATATLKVGGKTYTFHNGFCAEPIPKSDSFQLTLGFDIPAFGGPNNNSGEPGFSMDIAKHHTTAAVGFAYFGGHELVMDAQINLKGTIPADGTFTGKSTAISGTWNCHGVIAKS